MSAPAVDHDYAVAESITREQARNFYYGIRLLPRAKRSALCALYALARRIDDIGDGDLDRDEKQSPAGRAARASSRTSTVGPRRPTRC